MRLLQVFLIIVFLFPFFLLGFTQFPSLFAFLNQPLELERMIEVRMVGSMKFIYWNFFGLLMLLMLTVLLVQLWLLAAKHLACCHQCRGCLARIYQIYFFVDGLYLNQIKIALVPCLDPPTMHRIDGLGYQMGNQGSCQA